MSLRKSKTIVSPTNLTLILLGFSLCVCAQSKTNIPAQYSYRISSNLNVDAHLSALNAANLEVYRFRQSDRKIHFEDGVLIELFAAEKLKNAGHEINVDTYSDQTDVDKAVKLIFKLGPNNQIAVRSEIDPSSKLAKIGKGSPRPARTYISPDLFDQMEPEKQQMILDKPDLYRLE